MTPNGYDEPNFNRRGLCTHCAGYDDCERVEDNPVCCQCFDQFYNEAWSRKIIATDLSFEPNVRHQLGGAI